jgi:hypothetical protein
LLCTQLYKYAPNLESLLTQQYGCIMCTLWSDNTCVFTRFHSVKNANTQKTKVNLGTRCSLKMRDYRKWARTWISALLSARALRKILYLSSWQFHLCLVTERQTFDTPRMYTLSPSKSIKGSNYGEFLKDKNVLCTRLYKYAPNLESLLTQQYVCVMCTLWSDNTCVYSRVHNTFLSLRNSP